MKNAHLRMGECCLEPDLLLESLRPGNHTDLLIVLKHWVHSSVVVFGRGGSKGPSSGVALHWGWGFCQRIGDSAKLCSSTTFSLPDLSGVLPPPLPYSTVAILISG